MTAFTIESNEEDTQNVEDENSIDAIKPRVKWLPLRMNK